MTHGDIERKARFLVQLAGIQGWSATDATREIAQACLQLLEEGKELAEVVKETREFLKGWRAVSLNHIGLLSRVEAAIAKSQPSWVLWTEKEDASGDKPRAS